MLFLTMGFGVLMGWAHVRLLPFSSCSSLKDWNVANYYKKKCIQNISG